MNEIIYRWKLWKLHRARVKTLAAYRRQQDEARKQKKGREELESIIHDEMAEIDLIDDEIESLESRYLIESARRLVLPIPKLEKNSEICEESRITGRYRLSKKGTMDLRALVRKERKERRESAMLWLTALTGLVGALSGLLAILKS